MRKRSVPLIWLLAVMLFLFPVSVHAEGILLCIESDGRVEVENVRSGDCARNVLALTQEVHREYVAFEESVTFETECPTSCFDILLLASPSDGQIVSRVLDVPQKSIVLSPAVDVFPAVNLDDTPKSAAIVADPERHFSSTTLIRTVVLRV